MKYSKKIQLKYLKIEIIMFVFLCNKKMNNCKKFFLLLNYLSDLFYFIFEEKNDVFFIFTARLC